MAHDRFDPMQEITNMRENVRKAVDEGLRALGSSQASPRFPKVDVYETDDAVIVRTEPILGLVASSVEVSMEDDLLKLTGESQPDVNISEQAYIQRELRFGAFAREVRIPISVHADRAAAKLHQGVLTVTLPKAEPADHSQIISVTPVE